MIKFIIQSSLLDEQIQSTSFDDTEDYISFDDILEDELKISDTQENLGATQSGPKLTSSSKSVLKRRPNGHRQELVWRPPAHETIILSEISRDFQCFLEANISSLEPALSCRRGRYTARSPHRCPGYNRIEVTLTPDITRSTIVTYSSPTLDEICPVVEKLSKTRRFLTAFAVMNLMIVSPSRFSLQKIGQLKQMMNRCLLSDV